MGLDGNGIAFWIPCSLFMFMFVFIAVTRQADHNGGASSVQPFEVRSANGYF